MPVRGIRGAISAESNTKENILANTREMLQEIVKLNDLKREDIAGVFFTTTRDLNADFPAVGARQLGWTDVALMCGHEMEVPGALQSVIRVMIMVNTEKTIEQLVHVYLKEAQRLRPDQQPGRK